MTKPKFIVAANTMKKPKITFSRFMALAALCEGGRFDSSECPEARVAGTAAGHIRAMRRAKASTCSQSVYSFTVAGSVGPSVIHMMNRIIWRSTKPYLG